MPSPQPWEVGDEDERWRGYLDPSTGLPGREDTWILRNNVGARTWDQLREREDEAVEIRALTMPSYGIPATYDLDGLRAIHGHLFQDVYEWAGQVRTVDIAKGEPFLPPEAIGRAMDVVAETITATDKLRTVPEAEYAGSLARLYHVVNVAHPFREGTGWTQREFITALAAESGHTVDWTRVTGPVNDAASYRARQGDLGPLVGMFQTVVDKPTPAALPPSVGASFPGRATQATGYATGQAAPADRYRPPSPEKGAGSER